MNNFQSKNRLETVEKDQNLFYFYTAIIFAVFLTLTLIYASVRILRMKSKYLNCFKKKLDLVENISLQERTEIDTQISPRQEIQRRKQKSYAFQGRQRSQKE